MTVFAQIPLPAPFPQTKGDWTLAFSALVFCFFTAPETDKEDNSSENTDGQCSEKNQVTSV